MKILTKISTFILVISTIFTCKENPIIPSITTDDATEISYTSAVSGGVVKSEGGATVLIKGICYSINVDPTISDIIIIDTGRSGAFKCNLTNLTSNSLYYVKAFATNSVGTGYGEEQSFKTNQTGIASITTNEITSITSNTAVSGGNITNDNGASIIVRGVCWSTDPNPTIENQKTSDGSGTGVYVSNVEGLKRWATHYLRAYATNSIGTSYGNEISFFTTPRWPSIPTTNVISLTETSAVIEINVISDDFFPVGAKGMEYWQPYLTLARIKTNEGEGSGNFSKTITGLSPNTTYNLMAYATNSEGTAYGDKITFATKSYEKLFNPDLTYGAVTDIDGNTYKTITIGTQTWMAENLKVSHYRNGDIIPNVTDNSKWASDHLGGACCDMYNDTNYCNTYGKLYNWYAVKDSRNIAPLGWHVPTHSEWNILEKYLDNSVDTSKLSQVGTIVGSKMKETGTTHWLLLNSDATNESGFTALPGGYRWIGSNGSHTGALGYWERPGLHGHWWSSSSYNPDVITASWVHGLTYHLSSIGIGYKAGPEGLSIRCVKDY